MGPVVLLGLAALQSVQAQEVITLGPSCVTADCHADLSPASDLHGPVNAGDCEVCHETIGGEHVFRYPREGEALCAHCHELSLANVVHTPLREGDCGGCHDPHRSSITPLLVADPATELCQDCHREEPFLSAAVMHEPAESGHCILCHEAHSSWNRALLVETDGDLCMFCHEAEFEILRGMPHIHEPIMDDCLGCHDPHGSERAALVRGTPPDTCWACHGDMRSRIEESRVVHGAITQDDACFNCHVPHASPLNGLLRRHAVDLCLHCHSQEIETAEGDTVIDIAGLLASSEFLHGPVRSGACTSCHDPHASQHFRRLARDYPEHFYAPFDVEEYALCFMCHAQEAFLNAETTTVTNFRDADRNLHFVHVNSETKGRTCRACHEVHASNVPFHLRETVPYGGWDLPIGFELLADGGTCSPGCHEPRTYHRTAVPIEPLREIMPDPVDLVSQ